MNALQLVAHNFELTPKRLWVKRKYEYTYLSIVYWTYGISYKYLSRYIVIILWFCFLINL